MGWGHQKRRSGRQRLPPIVWTDLVFRQPPLEDLSLVKAREAWRSAVPWGQVADSSHGRHRMGRRKERKKLAPVATAPIPAHGKGGRVSSPTHCSTPQTRAGAPPIPQAPRDAVTREKPKMRKILVDLRPILENVMEPGDPWEGSSETRSGPSAGCSPREGGQPRGGDHASYGGASTAETAGITSLPPVAAQPRDSGQVAGAPELHAPRDNTLASQAAPRREPTSPVSFPKILLQQEPVDQPAPPERSSSAQRAGAGSLLQPARSPDIQLPTRLLLQRLQETTTSENHQLIAQVLQSLRKELQGEAPASPSEGERWRSLWDPLWSRQDPARRKNRKALGLDPAARERRLITLTWKAGSPIAGNTRGAACPKIHR